jgi:SAM-dependent methyltransferase
VTHRGGASGDGIPPGAVAPGQPMGPRNRSGNEGSENSQAATSFGSVAESYDRVRPGPAPAAMDWLVPPGCAVAVDLAAGTGLFTRALLGRAVRVIAVEPDTRMREVLARRSPEVDARAGYGEAMPLPDGAADAVFVSTAWHWLDLPRAVPEIARVLRPGGRLGVIWTSRDRTDDWVAELDLLKLDGIDQPDAAATAPRTPAEVRAWLDRARTITLPEGSPFGAGQTASFRFRRTMPLVGVLDWLATNSAFITASAAGRAAALARYRDVLAAHAVAGTKQDGFADGEPVIDMPMRSWCWRAERRGRHATLAGGAFGHVTAR